MIEKDNKKSRRDFLKKGMVSVAGISLFPSFIKGKNKAKEETKEKKNKKIIYRTLGRTGMKVPIVSLGATDPGITRAALGAGIIHLDTAYYYGGGSHETMLGEALKGRPRDSFVIATKIQSLLDYRTGLPPKNASATEIKADMRKKTETSLKRLQLDYVDILYLHGLNNPELAGLQMARDVMLELKKEGKTRFLGTSFHHKELELIPATVKEKIYDIILTTYNFRQPHREDVKKAIAYAAKAGLGIIA
ncbi:aldo/keto reductase, partial [bacterium]|nr:aldo/keto reductase [bacterium]